MRVGIVVALLCACGTYNPIDDVPHREFPDTASAIRAILEETGKSRVYAVGEYHPTEQMAAVDTPLARFTTEILPLLQPDAHHLVVEAWFDASCVSGADPVQAQIQAATTRPPSQHSDIAQLIAAARERMQMHGLPMTCIEHSSVLDPKGRVDFVRLLVMVTEKLYETTHWLVDQGRDVIVYGGAMHNDLSPLWPELAYAHALAREVSVLELDLVVPEIVAPIRLLWREPWFPLVDKAAPDRVLVYERGPSSYVMILPARGTAKVAHAGNVM
jgi:hypothetical protein